MARVKKQDQELLEKGGLSDPSSYQLDPARLSGKLQQMLGNTVNQLAMVEAAFDQLSEEFAEARKTIDKLTLQLAEHERDS